MLALTIAQPYAHLIGAGQKKVENRHWWTAFRGPLLIHAGTTKEWIRLSLDGREDRDYHIPLEEMVFGAIIAQARLVACVSVGRIRNGSLDAKFPWLQGHEHVEGPYCFVLEDVVKFENPIYIPGQPKFWRYDGALPTP